MIKGKPENNIINAREAALQALHNVEEEGAYANLALGKVLDGSRLTRQDKGLATELLYGTLKQKGRLDWILGGFLNRPLEKMDTWIRDILRLGAYQLLNMDRIPVSAAVNESVNLAKAHGHKGTAGLVNGVLRNIDRNRHSIKFPKQEEDVVAWLAVECSHPRWLVERWVKELGPEQAEQLCLTNNEVPPLTVRTNTLKTSREQLISALDEQGFEVTPTQFAPEGIVVRDMTALAGLDSFRRGLFTVQDESSMLVARVVAPQPGELVMDVCSAPGGKTTHLAQLMDNQGKLIAMDIHPHKVKLVAEHCRRLGLEIVDARVGDALNLPGEWENKADAVLVDAPCSGLGVLRRRPEIRWRVDLPKLGELAALQQQLLDRAALCVKVGGTLVYSTCTLTNEENKGVMEGFTQSHPGFALTDLTSFLPASLLEQGNLPTASEGYIQLLPHVHGTDGFFIARWERRV